MPSEPGLNLSFAFGFLLILARVSGLFALAPLPGFQALPEVSRIVLSIVFTLILLPVWPLALTADLTLGKFAWLIARQLEFGLLIGVSLAILLETLQLTAQFVGLQAGYSYASTIDPNSQADVAVLQVLTQLIAGSLFFSLGFDRDLLRLLALGSGHGTQFEGLRLDSIPGFIAQFGTAGFATALKLSLPVVSCLLLIDLSLALLGKLNAQLQLVSLSFPAKMIVGIVLLTFSLGAFARFERESVPRLIVTLKGILSN